MAQRVEALAGIRTLRPDRWWVEPLTLAVFLVIVIGYATWATIVDTNYVADPYLSPIYSPCLVEQTCLHETFRVIGAWWAITPALLIVWIPVGFRMTCYYYRKVYYRSFFASPPACAVKDAMARYSGETKFPFILQNLHRYLFWLSWPIIGFLWWDVVLAFQFEDGAGIGVGTLILTLNAAFFTLYSLSCHSCRHLLGGTLDVFSKNPVRYRAWRLVSRLNERHGTIALASLALIPLSDLYVRLLATDTIRDLRIF